MEMTGTDQNWIQEKVKSRLNSVSVCYHSVKYVLPSRLGSRNMKIRKYMTIILPLVLYGCETYSLILKEDQRLAGV
jgi:hypothetical protein